MILAAILAGSLIIIGICIWRKKGKLSLTVEEQLVINTLVNEKQKLLEDFKVGKEDIINEYEKLKQELKNTVGLQAKLPIIPSVPVKPNVTQGV